MRRTALIVLGAPALLGVARRGSPCSPCSPCWVTRGDGRRFAVTVDAGAEAAALLTALTDRAHR